MKTIPAALLAHYALAVTTVAVCLKVVRADGTVIGVTTAGEAVTLSGVTYQPGFDLSSLETTDSLAVDNMELKFVAFDSIVPRADIVSGLWNNAFFEISQYNMASPSDGVDILKRGHVGKITLRTGTYVAELLSLKQLLQQTQGIVLSKTCRARFADYPAQFGSSRCGLTAASFISTGTLTAVTDARTITDSGRAQATDYFTEGLLKMTSGPASGFSAKVKQFTAGGAFLLSLPLPYTPVVGNTYQVIAGCRKRREDCIAFGNILNFQGEPDGKGLDKATGSGMAVAQPATTPTVATDTLEFPGGP